MIKHLGITLALYQGLSKAQIYRCLEISMTRFSAIIYDITNGYVKGDVGMDMIRSRLNIVTLLVLFFTTFSAQAGDVKRVIFLPNELLASTFTGEEKLYLAGFVSNVERAEGEDVFLKVTDGHATITVKYSGVLPDLIIKGVPAMFDGWWQSRTFMATSVLLIAPKGCASYLSPEAQAELISLGFYQCSLAGS